MFKHILVAIDASAYTEQVLPTAIEVAKHFDGDVFVLHVSEHDRGRSAAYSIESPADATRLVGEAVKKIKDAGVRAKGELVDRAAGHIANAIVEAAAANDIDLIVMGSRGLSDTQGILLGSVAHKVMQLAEVPVLVTRKAKTGAKPALAEASAVGPSLTSS